MTEPSRLGFLDGLRLLAALAVLSKHWVGVGAAAITEDGQWVYPWGPESPEKLFGPWHGPAVYGWLGVNIFFLISGFVIAMSGWGRTLGGFFTARVARLFPAYWFAVLLTVAVVSFRPGLTNGQVRGGVENAVLNLTMVQAAYGGPSVDPSYWTLWWELRFYLIFAVVVMVGLTYRRVVAFCALWTVGAVVAEATDNKLLDLVAMPQYAPYFIAGVAFHLIHRFGGNLLLTGIVGFNYLLALHFVDRDIASQIRESDITARTDELVALAVTCFFLVMAMVALHVLDRIDWRWLTVAGALSYPLYLMHQVIGFVVIRELRPYLSPPAVVAVALIAMVVLAHLVRHFVERPMGRWLRRGLTQSFAALRHESPAELSRN
ncbi:acyltransferase [Amorphoplanes nipponensis]|uniref:Acyltransferase n=1 Tax=Actinoplanes nipponensis TaxID=135950 RepID=A0A919JCG3_9ACTN|nr:acyltransferase [Actinoplanes nipponensis]